jgi:ammonia channel protein AmtB
VLLGALAYYATGHAFSYGTNESPFIGNHGFFLNDVNPCDYMNYFFAYAFAATSTSMFLYDSSKDVDIFILTITIITAILSGSMAGEPV